MKIENHKPCNQFLFANHSRLRLKKQKTEIAKVGLPKKRQYGKTKKMT